MEIMKCPDCGKVFTVDEKFQYNYSDIETKFKNIMEKIDETISKYEKAQKNLKQIESHISSTNDVLFILENKINKLVTIVQQESKSNDAFLSKKLTELERKIKELIYNKKTKKKKKDVR